MGQTPTNAIEPSNQAPRSHSESLDGKFTRSRERDPANTDSTIPLPAANLPIRIPAKPAIKAPRRHSESTDGKFTRSRARDTGPRDSTMLMPAETTGSSKSAWVPAESIAESIDGKFARSRARNPATTDSTILIESRSWCAEHEGNKI